MGKQRVISCPVTVAVAVALRVAMLCIKVQHGVEETHTPRMWDEGLNLSVCHANCLRSK
ncbi:MAG: hypothetical protein RLZZ502_216 [Pseudomonadota bacterium]